MTFKFQCLQIMSYWDKSVLFHLHIISDFLCATTAELNNCDRDLMAYKT